MIFGLVITLIGLFFWRGFFRSLVPIPLDALVGVYHPWADHFWGFAVGVPYKNISLTDVFSQLYPWRLAVIDAWRNLSIPLWNPYSFAGYPLAANWQSAAFFPLNILMIIFGSLTGYGLLVALQPVLAMVFMAVFLRQIGLSKIASLIGAVSFAFGGYMMTYLTWATTGFILAFIPLALFLIEKYLASKNIKFLFFLSLTIFLILTGGFFQPALFALIIIGGYGLKAKKKAFLIYLWMALGIGLAAIQLLPTLELLGNSIRNLDHNIAEYNYGLLPVKSLVTLLAPDFFGNPATGNYFGPIQYQEASGYFGIIGLALAMVGLIWSKKNFRTVFFGIFFLVSLILTMDTPIGRVVFEIPVPLISTGYASRWLMVTALSGSVLAAFGVEAAGRKKKVLVCLLFLAILTLSYYWADNPVSRRNLILPIALTAAGLVLFILPRKRVFLAALFLLVAFDLLRYGSKFTPMAESRYGQTEIAFLTETKELAGIDRVAIDQGPVVPANTWMYYQIQTIGGYDPLLYRDWGVWFRALNIGANPDQKIDGSLGRGDMTRYLNLDNPYSPLLDLAGVKYLVTLKKNKDGQYKADGEINSELLKKYTMVEEFGATVLLENKTAMPRVKLFYEAESELDNAKAAERLVAGFDFRNKLLLKTQNPVRFDPDSNDSLEITRYLPNTVELKAVTKNGAYLFLSDSDYPGWRVMVNSQEKEIIRADGIFRAVALPAGEAFVRFDYFPVSFRLGLLISGVSLISIVGIYWLWNRR